MNKKERLVAAIENGTVIDHIPAGKTYQVVNLLELQSLNTPVTIGNNFVSKKIGKKGIIKVSDKFFSDEEISRLSVVAPKIVLNIINPDPIAVVANIRCQNCSSTRAQRRASAAGRKCRFAIPAIQSNGCGLQGHSFGVSRREMGSGFAAIWCISISAIIGQNRNFTAVESGGRTERPSSSGNATGAKKLSISCASARSCLRCC